MSAISDPVGFELDDILTRVIPGAVFVFSISIAIFELNLLPDSISYSPYSTTFIAFGVVLSFVFGELIELFRYQAFRTPRTFNQLVYRTTRNIEHLYWSDQFRLRLFDWASKQDISESNQSNLRLRSKLLYIPWMNESEYYVEEEYSDNIIKELADSNPLPGDEYFPDYLYYHLLKQVESSLNKDAKRRQTLSRFYINFKISLVPTFVFITYITYVWIEGMSPILFIILAVVAFFIIYFYGIIFVNTFLGSVQIAHISDLLREYLYQKEIASERD